MSHTVRARCAPFLLALSAVFANACGGSSPPPSSPGGAAPYGEPSKATDAPAGQQGYPPSQAPAQAPAAGAMPGSARGEAPAEESEAGSDLDVLGRRLDGALRLSTPDCATAYSLRDRICDLAQRLCDLAGRSAEPEVAERCSDGRSRCERATARVRASCPD